MAESSSSFKKAPIHPVYSGCPPERIPTHILGGLSQTLNGNKYILVVADYLTKRAEAFELPNIWTKYWLQQLLKTL